MRTTPRSLVRCLFTVLSLALLLAQARPADAKSDEAAHVRFLIVVDTHDSAGATWGLDGKNLKAVLEAGLRKQKLDGQFTIEAFTGNDVAPGKVLKHYADLKVKPNEALVFYYSGHGAYNASKGHFMAFTHGPLFRNDLLAAMQQHNPRLTVLLTDCCADYAGNPGGISPPRPGTRPANSSDGIADIPDADPPRRESKKAPGLAYPFFVQTSQGPSDDRGPPRARTAPAGNTPAGNGVVLRTGDGPLSLKTIIEQSDGEVMRHLFFRHAGLVDINGCQKGKSSHGTIPWGGSLFTIGLLSLQKEKAASFDANGNGVVEWSEFFPHLQTSCDRAGKKVSNGQIRQIPEATQLGKPSIARR